MLSRCRVHLHTCVAGCPTASSKSKVDNLARPSNTLINYDNKYGKKEKESVKIHTHTLAPYDGYGGGLYWMTSVKKMTSKKDFMDMDFKDKNCVFELYEDCKTKGLLEACRCVLWEMPGFKVRICKQDMNDSYFITGHKKVQCQRQRLY